MTMGGEGSRESSGVHRAPAEDGELLDAFIDLSSDLNVGVREEELVRMFAEVFDRLLPGRLLCIRLVDEENRGLKLVYANGRLVDTERDALRLTERALERLKMDDGRVESLVDEGHLRIGGYRNLFVDGVEGFDVALGDRNSLYGVLNFEYTETGERDERDLARALPLAYQMSAALRNARSMAEAVLLKDYLEKLLDHANAPVVALDREGRITRVNQALERQTGYDRDELVGEELEALLSEPDRARLLSALRAAKRGEKASNIEVSILREKDGSRTHIAFNTAAVFSAFGEVEALVLVGQDLTEVRALQKQVIHSEKLATLGQVAAGVAHELNNPLTSITVYGNYLTRKLEGSVDEGDLTKLKRIVESAERIQSFTRDLVTYARPSGEEPTLVRVNELIDRALSFCEHMVNEAGADVTLELEQDLPAVYGIQGQLEQVLVNLLTNACHALAPSGGRIRLGARAADDERIEIEISDDGCGIPSENVCHLFEPFFSTKDQGEGTGLGLSIVRNILDNHDADIEVNSDPEHGTTFTISIYAG